MCHDWNKCWTEHHTGTHIELTYTMTHKRGVFFFIHHRNYLYTMNHTETQASITMPGRMVSHLTDAFKNFLDTTFVFLFTTCTLKRKKKKKIRINKQLSYMKKNNKILVNGLVWTKTEMD